MSLSKPPSVGFDFTQLNKTSGQAKSSGAASASTQVGADSFALQFAQMRSQQLDSLVGAAFGGNSAVATQSASLNPMSLLAKSGQASGLTPTGRVASLFNPESAFKMMSVINKNDANYKAQYSELSQMGTAVKAMQQEGQSLESISSTSSNDSIKAQLQEFASKYNAWVQKFDADVKEGGVLAHTQAADVSRFELRQNVQNVFYGAAEGVRGMYDLGLTIDPKTNLASLDASKLDSVLASNKKGAIAALQDFSVNFTKSAELLNSKGNFISNQLNNLSKAIAYVANNKSSLQAEFGTGDTADTAKSSEQVTKALAAYNQSSGTKG